MEAKMNIRTGFYRLSLVFLVLIVLVGSSIIVSGGYPMLESFGALALVAGGYWVACKAIAWVFNGFTASQKTR